MPINWSGFTTYLGDESKISSVRSGSLTDWGTNANTETSWFAKGSNQMAVAGGFQIAGGLLSSFSQYKQAKDYEP